MLPFAHAGHILFDLAAFSPILALAIWFVIVGIRDKVKDDDDDEE